MFPDFWEGARAPPAPSPTPMIDSNEKLSRVGVSISLNFTPIKSSCVIT